MLAFDVGRAAAAFAAAFVAGAINSIAGGGTLVSFPTLIWLGLPPVVANATNTVAVWPGSLGSMWGYRRELADIESRMLLLAVPSIVGGVAGALLLRLTPAPLFSQLVPFLILFATVLFMLQDPVQRWLKKSGGAAHDSGKWLAGAAVFQLLVGLYGGYFGAGIGILMLAALSILGVVGIHRMNGLKNLFALCINGSAALYFLAAGMVHWRYALLMAVGAIVGGYACAGFARRMTAQAVRRVVIVIGLGMALSLLIAKK